MRIIYFDYNNECLPPLLRSFELTRAAASLGHTVMLCLCHERMRQYKWFFEMIVSVQTNDFIVSFNKPVSFLPSPPGEPSKIKAWKMVRSGVYANRFILPEIKKILAFKPDVIIARPDHVYSFLITSLFTRVPLVISPDGPIEELSAMHNYTPKWPIGFDLWRAKKAKAILYINEICGNLWKKKGIPGDRLFLCPNGVDPETFSPLKTEDRSTLRKNLGFSDDEIVVGFCGNQRYWHGLHNLFKAFPLLRDSFPQTKMLIVGALENPDAAGVDMLPGPVRNNTVFTGPIEYPHMPRYMDAIDIMVMPYPKYHLFHFSPMKMFESLSMAKIIVASAQGQVLELLHGLPSAFLYDPEDENGLENALHSACEALMQNPALGETSRTFVKNGHSWRDRGKQVIAACEYALRNCRLKRRTE